MPKVLLVMLIAGISQYALALSTAEPEGYQYFPSNKKASQLALTAQGSFVKMTYTPATYEIRVDPGNEFVELEIFDAPLKPGSGSEDVNDLGMNALMKLTFVNNGGTWKVKCKSNDETLAKTSTDAENREIIIGNSTACQFREKDWGEVLKVYPGSGKSSLIMKTAWDDSTNDENYGYSSHRDLINVFKFRTRNGTINLAPTDQSTIIQFPGQSGFDFKKEEKKQSYAHAVNWSILYNTSASAIFDFEIDVRGKSEIFLFDKDADAHKLYGPTIPADEGITMSVVWSDGTPVKDWTMFDQTDRGAFKDTNYVSGEQNSYQGPSGDTGIDEQGIKSIQWYKIPVSEQKADSIKVTWSGFGVDYNGFGFASTSPVSSHIEEDLEEPPPEDICEPDDLKCLEALEKCDGDPECLEDLKECNGDPVCIEEVVDEYDPTTPKCREAGALRACISSNPFPDPHPDSYLEKGDSITYHITLENISDTITLTNLNLGFEPPELTSLNSTHFSEITPQSGTGTYTGKGPGRFDLASSLEPTTTLQKNVTVTLDTDTPLQDYDISTAEKIIAAASNNSSVTLKKLIHHVGDGAVNIQISRCYAYDYFGGEFKCNTTCSTVEPGTKITVRDMLTNTGGTAALDFAYKPPPLSGHFSYDPNSIRIDDPITGLSVSNDGTSFPPASGITIPGPIESSGSRTVFFTYFVPDDLLETDEPSEEEQRDGKCYPKSDEEMPAPGTYTEVSYETDCDIGEDDEEGSRNGLICVKVEENPKLEVELTAIPSTDNPVYQGSIITYVLRITNTTRQPVSQLNIIGTVPAQTTCIDSCIGVDLIDPAELQEKGIYEYTFTVQVNEDASGSSITHAGINLIFSGESEEEFEAISNAVVHDLIAAPEPSGDFQHDISLSRRIVLDSKDRQPRADEGDVSEVKHVFSYTGTKKFVKPYLSNGAAPPLTYSWNYCNEIGWNGPDSIYDAPHNSSMIVYNTSAALRNQLLSSYSQITNDSMTFTITTELPNERPEFLNTSGRGRTDQDLISYQVHASKIVESNMNAVNYFMRNGGEIVDGVLEHDGRNINTQLMPETSFRAVADGQGGEISTSNVASTPQGRMSEDTWQYRQFGNRPAINCTRSCGRRTCTRRVTPPEYKWQLISSKTIPLEASDKDYITVLSSVAWLQTKNGNIGFGEPLWVFDPTSGDPNWVQLSDKTISSAMKFYTPPNEYNADFIVFSPDTQDPLRSRAGAKIRSDGFDQGFLDSETSRLSRGEAYDRSEFSRDYLDDLLNKQVYGKVIRLNAERPSGFNLAGNILLLNGTAHFEPDTIYYYKGNAQLGNSSTPLIISGGRARLVIEGDVRIEGNIRYLRKSSPSLSDIPSLRLHSLGDINIDPSITDVELMMLAEKEFHSGQSDLQLKILGDVIAYQSFWERRPLNEQREDEDMVNKPSEIIYEDFRKYVLTPPGDKKLPDPGHFWKEVGVGGASLR